MKTLFRRTHQTSVYIWWLPCRNAKQSITLFGKILYCYILIARFSHIFLRRSSDEDSHQTLFRRTHQTSVYIWWLPCRNAKQSITLFGKILYCYILIARFSHIFLGRSSDEDSHQTLFRRTHHKSVYILWLPCRNAKQSITLFGKILYCYILIALFFQHWAFWI